MIAEAALNPTVMAAELARIAIPLAAGLLVGALLDRAAKPRVRSELAPWTALIGGGLWLAAFACVAWVTGRPVTTGCALLALHGALVAASNAKYLACGEPLAFADVPHCVQAMIDSRRGPPWFPAHAALSWMLLAAFALAGLARLEPPLEAVAVVPLAVLLAVAIATVRFATGPGLRAMTFDPIRDLARFGLAAGLWLQGRAEGQLAGRKVRGAPWPARTSPASFGRPPHVLCVQAADFFDARRLHRSIRPELLSRLDTLGSRALSRGRLVVPPSGGSEARAEHAFLTGVPPSALGVERFDPYRHLDRLASASLVRHARELGYAPVCIAPRHLAPGRRAALEALGFDEIVDLSALAPDGSLAEPDLAEGVLRMLEGAVDTPLFVVALAMAGHAGSEPGRAEDVAAVYRAPPPAGCEALTAYLRRLKDLDALVGRLGDGLRWLERDTVACVHGARVPNLPDVYDAVGMPDGLTEYVVWRAHREGLPRVVDRAVEELGAVLLAEALRLPAAAAAPANDPAHRRVAEPFAARAAIIRSSVGA